MPNVLPLEFQILLAFIQKMSRFPTAQAVYTSCDLSCGNHGLITYLKAVYNCMAALKYACIIDACDEALSSAVF